jgi:hypothetical protein
MEIQVGDKVRFLNDVGGGIVSRIIDRKSVMVTNDYGFDVPVPIHELVVIEQADDYNETAQKNTSQNAKQVEQAQEIVVDPRDIFFPEIAYVKENGNDIKVFFAFVPQGRPGNSDLDVFLINDSNYNILYHIINKEENGDTYANAVGVLEANTKEQIETLALASVNQLPEYEFQFLFYQKGNFKAKEPVSKALVINPIKFYKERTYLENDFFDKDAILMPVYTENLLARELEHITSSDLQKIIKQKEQAETKPSFSSPKAKENQIEEVDLHIHELLDDFRGLSNAEMLEVQMEHFKSKLEEAINTHIKKIVFIHGVGNGVLKMEIRKELDKLTKKLTYQDASFKEYGYGATLVQIK